MRKINTKDMMKAWRELQLIERTRNWAAIDKARAEFEESAARLTAAIKEAEGRATARTVTSREIISTLARVEDKIGVKKALNGTTVEWDGGQKFANAYGHTPYSTHWTAEYKNGHWNIIEIKRWFCPNRYESGRVNYSDEAKQTIIDRASAL